MDFEDTDSFVQSHYEGDYCDDINLVLVNFLEYAKEFQKKLIKDRTIDKLDNLHAEYLKKIEGHDTREKKYKFAEEDEDTRKTITKIREELSPFEKRKKSERLAQSVKDMYEKTWKNLYQYFIQEIEDYAEYPLLNRIKEHISEDEWVPRSLALKVNQDITTYSLLQELVDSKFDALFIDFNGERREDIFYPSRDPDARVINWYEMHKNAKHYSPLLATTDTSWESGKPDELYYNIEKKYSFLLPDKILKDLKNYIHFALVSENYIKRNEIMGKTEFERIFENIYREMRELPFDLKYDLDRFEHQLKLRGDNIGKNWVMPKTSVDSYLDQLTKSLHDRTIVTVHGKGGMGKTALVYKWLDDYFAGKSSPKKEHYKAIISLTTKEYEFDEQADPRMSKFGTGYHKWHYSLLLREIVSYDNKDPSRMRQGELRETAQKILRENKFLLVLDNFEDILDKPRKLKHDLKEAKARDDLDKDKVAKMENKIIQSEDKVKEIIEFLNDLGRTCNSNVILTTREKAPDLNCNYIGIEGFDRKQARRLMVKYFQNNKIQKFQHLSKEGKRFFPWSGDGSSGDEDEIFSKVVEELDKEFLDKYRVEGHLSVNLTYPIIIKHLADLLVEKFSEEEYNEKDIGEVMRSASTNFLLKIEDHYEWASREAFSEIERDDNHPKSLDILKKIYIKPSNEEELANSFANSTLKQIQDKIEIIRRHDIFVTRNEEGAYSILPEAKMFISKKLGHSNLNDIDVVSSKIIEENRGKISQLQTILDEGIEDINSVIHLLNDLNDIGARTIRQPTLLLECIDLSKKINPIYDKYPGLAKPIDRFDDQLYKLCGKHISKIIAEDKSGKTGFSHSKNHLEKVLEYLTERHKEKFCEATKDIWELVLNSLDNDSRIDLITPLSGPDYRFIWIRLHRFLMEKQDLTTQELDVFHIALRVEYTLKFMKNRNHVIRSVTKFLNAIRNSDIPREKKKIMEDLLVNKFLSEINIKDETCLNFLNSYFENNGGGMENIPLLPVSKISEGFARNKLIMVAEASDDGYKIVHYPAGEAEIMTSGLAYIQEFDYSQPGSTHINCIRASDDVFLSIQNQIKNQEDSTYLPIEKLIELIEIWKWNGHNLRYIRDELAKRGYDEEIESLYHRIIGESFKEKLFIFNRENTIKEEWRIGPTEVIRGTFSDKRYTENQWVNNNYFMDEHGPEDLEGLEEKLYKIARKIMDLKSQGNGPIYKKSPQNLSEKIMNSVNWEMKFKPLYVTPKELWEIQKDMFATEYNGNEFHNRIYTRYDVTMHWLEENFDRSGLQEKFEDRELNRDDYLLFGEFHHSPQRQAKVPPKILITRPTVNNYTKSPNPFPSIIQRAIEERPMERQLISIIVNILQSKTKHNLTKTFLKNKSNKDLDAIYKQTLKETIYQRFVENIYDEWQTSPIDQASDFMLEYLQKNSISDSEIEPWW